MPLLASYIKCLLAVRPSGFESFTSCKPYSAVQFSGYWVGSTTDSCFNQLQDEIVANSGLNMANCYSNGLIQLHPCLPTTRIRYEYLRVN